MERSEVVALVRRLYECVSHDDIDGAVALLDEDYVLHDLGDDIVGRDAMREYFRQYTRAFPGMTIEPDGNILVDGDRCALEWVARGTHEGELAGIAPTHREVEVRGIEISLVRDGRLIETTQEWDMMGLFQQLDALPAEAGKVPATA